MSQSDLRSHLRNCRSTRGPLYRSGLDPVIQPNRYRRNAESDSPCIQTGQTHLSLHKTAPTSGRGARLPPAGVAAVSEAHSSTPPPTARRRWAEGSSADRRSRLQTIAFLSSPGVPARPTAGPCREKKRPWPAIGVSPITSFGTATPADFGGARVSLVTIFTANLPFVLCFSEVPGGGEGASRASEGARP